MTGDTDPEPGEPDVGGTGTGESDRVPTLRVVSFNVRYAGADEGELAWERRRDAVADVLRALRPDVVGLQEVWLDQLPDLRERLAGFEWVGEPAAGGEHTPIGVRLARLRIEGNGAYALSETPDRLGSVGWDATYPRTATVARLRDRLADRPLAVHNVHLDHEGATARAEGADLIARRLPEDRPAVVTGDLNCTPGSPPYGRLVGAGSGADADAEGSADVDAGSAGDCAGLTDATAAVDPFGPAESYVGFDDGTTPRRLDYVLAALPIADAGVGSRTADGRVGSDHRPVAADLRTNGGSI